MKEAGYINKSSFLLAGMDPAEAPRGCEPVLIDARRVRGMVPRWRGVHMGDIDVDLDARIDPRAEVLKKGERPPLPRFTEADFALLHECGANTVRLGFTGGMLEDDDRSPGRLASVRITRIEYHAHRVQADRCDALAVGGGIDSVRFQ